MTPNGRPIVFGEALFDVLPDDKEVLGGAPLNVAWHLQAFGYNPLVISRVGSDARGSLIRETMQKWGLDTQGLQTDSQHPTGIVTISHEASGPAYRIEPNQAYDHIAFDNTLQNLNSEQCSLLLHGTLALRAYTSHETLSTLREKLNIPVFADVNRRPPWWNSSIAQETLRNATWVKVNEQELQAISEMESFQGNQYQEFATRLVKQYKNIEILFVTLGAQGSFAITQSGETFYEKSVPLPATELDTIGAGDAFTAIAIIGLLRRWPIDIILRRANAFASAICRIPSATTTNRDVYEAELKFWTDA
mgnify:FL=1